MSSASSAGPPSTAAPTPGKDVAKEGVAGKDVAKKAKPATTKSMKLMGKIKLATAKGRAPLKALFKKTKPATTKSMKLMGMIKAKAKAKTKAKAKPKAQANADEAPPSDKGQGKDKGKKAKPAKGLKTACKSRAEMTVTKNPGTEPKPSTKRAATTKDHLTELRQFINGGGEIVPEGTPDDGAPKKRPTSHQQDTSTSTETRDRMKQYYFKEEMKSNSLDPEIMAVWERCKGSRKAATAFINGVMVRDRDGKFKPDRMSPQFLEMREKTTGSYWNDESTGVPRGLAEAQWGGADKLQTAILAGDVKETEDEGQTFYSWRQIKVGKGGKVEQKLHLERTNQIDDGTYGKLSDMLDKVGWKFKLTSRQQTVFTQNPTDVGQVLLAFCSFSLF